MRVGVEVGRWTDGMKKRGAFRDYHLLSATWPRSFKEKVSVGWKFLTCSATRLSQWVVREVLPKVAP